VDPEAARAVISNPVLAPKTTLITLDLTHQCLATKPIRESLLRGPEPTEPPSQLRILLKEILEFFAKSYDEDFNIKAGPPLHDPLAVAVVFGYGSIYEDDGERYEVSVVTAGDHSTLDSVRGQVGRTEVKKVDRANSPSSQGVRIPRKLNVDAFWQVLEDCTSIAERHSSKATTSG